MTVGIRKLRENLSHYLDLAKGGEEVVVTERGKPVVRIGACKRDKLAELVAQGRVRPPLRKKRPLRPEDRISLAELGFGPEDGPSPITDQLLRDRGR